MIFLWSHCGKWHRSWEMGPVSRSMVPLSTPLSWGPANLLGNSAWRYLGEISLGSQYCYRSIYLYLESHYYFRLSEHQSHSSQYSKLIPFNSTTHSSSVPAPPSPLHLDIPKAQFPLREKALIELILLSKGTVTGKETFNGHWERRGNPLTPYTLLCYNNTLP